MAQNSFRINIDTDNGNISPDFVVGDLVVAQHFDGRNSVRIEAVVREVGSDYFTIIASSVFTEEQVLSVRSWSRFGNYNDTTRQSYITMDAEGTNSPQITLFDGVDNLNKIGAYEQTRVLIGNLNNITDPNFPDITGYGIVTDNGYFRGDFVLNSTGENIQSLIQANNDAIQLRVTQIDFNNLSDTVTTQGTSITQNTDNIALRVETSTFNNTITNINDTLTTKANLSTIIAEINLSQEGVRITGDRIQVGNFTIDNTYLYTGNVVTTNSYTAAGDITLGNGVIRTHQFRTDTDGTAHFAGNLDAPSGTIGGMTVNPSTLTFANITLDSSGTIRENSDRWRLNSDGSGILASSRIIWDASGNGTLSGWNFDTDSLYTGTKQTVNDYSTSGMTIFGGGNGAIRAQQFRLDTNGSAHFRGVLDAPSGTIGGITIEANSLNAIIGTGAASRGFILDSSASNIKLVRSTTILENFSGIDFGTINSVEASIRPNIATSGGTSTYQGLNIFTNEDFTVSASGSMFFRISERFRITGGTLSVQGDLRVGDNIFSARGTRGGGFLNPNWSTSSSTPTVIPDDDFYQSYFLPGTTGSRRYVTLPSTSNIENGTVIKIGTQAINITIVASSSSQLATGGSPFSNGSVGVDGANEWVEFTMFDNVWWLSNRSDI